jgi:hypothetical protein
MLVPVARWRLFLVARRRQVQSFITIVIPGRAQREPGIQAHSIEIPGLVLRTIPE